MGDRYRGLAKSVQEYPDDQEYRFSLGRLYTYRPQTRDKGLQLLESIPPITRWGTRHEMRGGRRCLGRRASLFGRIFRAYLTRYPDPELQKMLSEMKPPAPAPSAEAKADLLRGREEKLGYTALNGNRLAEAQEHFEAALKESPKSVGALSGLGFVSMKKEDFDSAVNFFEQAKSVAPANKQIPQALSTARFWKDMQAAAAAQKENRVDDAVELFRQALTMRPANIEASTGLAGSYMQQGQPASAIPLYESIVRLQPQNTEAWRSLVTARYQTHNYADALAAAKRIPDGPRAALQKDPEYLAVLAFIHAEAGEDRESARYLQQALAAAREKTRSSRLACSSNSRACFCAPARPIRPLPPSSVSPTRIPQISTLGKVCSAR